MRCERAREKLSAKLDGQLNRAENSRLEEHLSSCSDCQVVRHKIQAIDHLLSSAPMMQAPAWLRAQVQARIRHKEQVRRRLLGGTILTLGTLALALLVLAPLIIGLLSSLGIAPALISGGPETVAQLLTIISASIRALLVLLDQLAPSLAVLSLGSLLIALALNALWINTLRRLQTTR